jgi:RNA polymerase sigma-70 factor (ECF subfamily)
MSTFLHIEVSPACLQGACAGQPGSQRRLYEALARPVYTLLLRLVVRPAIAEELLHEVFLDVLGHLDDYNGAGPFAGWVRTIAVRRALAHLRSPWQGRLASGPLEELAADRAGMPALAMEWHGDLERALNALPAISRSVVWLHDVEGYTHSEIGALYDQTASFSKSQLARAHSALRERLEPTVGAPACTLASKT